MPFRRGIREGSSEKHPTGEKAVPGEGDVRNQTIMRTIAVGSEFRVAYPAPRGV